MIVKYIENKSSECCIATVNHASVQKDEQSGKYTVVLMLPKSFAELVVTPNDRHYSSCMDIIHELYDKEKIDFVTNKNVTCETFITMPNLDGLDLSNFNIDDIDLSAMEDYDPTEDSDYGDEYL